MKKELIDQHKVPSEVTSYVARLEIWNDEEQTETLSNIPLYTYNISGTNL